MLVRERIEIYVILSFRIFQIYRVDVFIAFLSWNYVLNVLGLVKLLLLKLVLQLRVVRWVHNAYKIIL